MEEGAEVNLNLLKYAKYTTMAMLLLVLGQSMTGVGSVTSTGLSLTDSHKHGAMLGLGLSVVAVALIMASKTEDKGLKGKGFEAFSFWFLMYGLGEMSVNMNHKISMIHAAVGLLMFARLMMMVKAFPSEESD